MIHMKKNENKKTIEIEKTMHTGDQFYCYEIKYAVKKRFAIYI